MVESAWCYRHLPRVREKLRQEGLPAEINEIAWKAQNRLHNRYMKLTLAGMDPRKVMVAIGRELLGFIWAIGVKAEQACQQSLAARKTKAKTFPTREKTKPLNDAIQLEDKVSRSRSKHEGKLGGSLRQAIGWTRRRSQRQLPTDLDYAVPTREYQLDQSSPLPATAAADPVLEQKKRPAHLDLSLHQLP